MYELGRQWTVKSGKLLFDDEEHASDLVNDTKISDFICSLDIHSVCVLKNVVLDVSPASGCQQHGCVVSLNILRPVEIVEFQNLLS